MKSSDENVETLHASVDDLAQSLEKADQAIEACLKTNHVDTVTERRAQLEAFEGIFTSVAALKEFLAAAEPDLNHRPLSRLLEEWRDIHNGAKPKFTAVQKPSLSKGGKPATAERNEYRALLIAAANILIDSGMKVKDALNKVSKDSGVSQKSLTNWRSSFTRENGVRREVRDLAEQLRHAPEPDRQYLALIQQYQKLKK